VAGAATAGRFDLSARACTVAIREDFYDYVPVAAGAVEWHVNFADRHLFGFYGSSLLAQDEMQVTEHPVLASLKEALDANGRPGLTIDGDDRPTPVLVTGAERCCQIATEPNRAEGRPAGLYGNAFGRAREDVVRRATKRIDPPTITNVIAMAARAAAPVDTAPRRSKGFSPRVHGVPSGKAGVE